MANNNVMADVAIELEKKVHRNKISGMMKSVRVHKYGTASVLDYEMAPIPVPGPDEILIKVYAAGVNPADWKLREGYMRDAVPMQFPFIPGCEVSGTVVNTGILVTSFEEGDVVFARVDIANSGCYSEYVLVKAGDIAYAPDTLTMTQAAGVPFASQAAWMGLFEIGKLKANQKVLIQGGSGGVGSFAVQLAKIAGAHVIATTSGENYAMVKSLGADEVIDYTAGDFSHKHTNLDMIFDTVGGEAQEVLWKMLRKGATLVSTMSVDEDKASKYGVIGKSFLANSNGARLQEISRLIDKHFMKVAIGREYELQDAAAAHELSQSGKASGKLILRVQNT